MALRHFTFLILLLLSLAWSVFYFKVNDTGKFNTMYQLPFWIIGGKNWMQGSLTSGLFPYRMMLHVHNASVVQQTQQLPNAHAAVVTVEKVLLANVISFFTPILGLHQQCPQSSLSRSQMWYHPLSWQGRCTQDNLVTLIYTLRLLEVTNVAFPAMVGSITTCQWPKEKSKMETIDFEPLRASIEYSTLGEGKKSSIVAVFSGKKQKHEPLALTSILFRHHHNWRARAGWLFYLSPHQ